MPAARQVEPPAARWRLTGELEQNSLTAWLLIDILQEIGIGVPRIIGCGSENRREVRTIIMVR